MRRSVHHQFIVLISASIIPGTCLVGVCLSGCNSLVAVGLMIVATCFYGSMFAGVFSNHTDIASNYAGKICSLWFSIQIMFKKKVQTRNTF